MLGHAKQGMVEFIDYALPFLKTGVAELGPNNAAIAARITTGAEHLVSVSKGAPMDIGILTSLTDDAKKAADLLPTMGATTGGNGTGAYEMITGGLWMQGR